MTQHKKVALIAGAGTGSGFSTALIQQLSDAGYAVAALTRREETARALGDALGETVGGKVSLHTADLLEARAVEQVVAKVEAEHGPVSALIHTAGRLTRGGLADATIGELREGLDSNVVSALLVAQAVTPHMLERRMGAMIFTGATASIRGGACFLPFAAAKFALRGFVQALARELSPKGIHVAHVVVDGVIWGKRADSAFSMRPEQCVDPHALARTYVDLLGQHPSCWTQELDVRPAEEKF